MVIETVSVLSVELSGGFSGAISTSMVTDLGSNSLENVWYWKLHRVVAG